MSTDTSTAVIDVLNPFLVVEGPDEHKVTIHSAIDSFDQTGGLVLATNIKGLGKYAQVIDPTWDLDVYATQVTLATSLVNPGRTIRIFCDRLCVLASDDGNSLKIDVSATIDTETFGRPMQVTDRENTTAGGALDGDFIATSVNNGKADPQWFPGNKVPDGTTWGMQGPTGGTIGIVCNVLELQGAGLELAADGGPGYPGASGQNCTRFIKPETIGGAAGAGGKGGDGGLVSWSAYTIIDADKKTLSPTLINAHADGGKAGMDGLPGYVEDELHVLHYGSKAPPVSGGDGGDAGEDELATFEDEYPDPLKGTPVKAPMPDLSAAARNMSLLFWSNLYHRVKLSYIENQAMGYNQHFPSGWAAMQPLIYGAYCLTHAYDDDSLKSLTPSTPIDTDPDLAAKCSMANAIGVMMTWYRTPGGRSMWGHPISYVDNLPWRTKMKLLEGGYEVQKDVRDLYIKVRKDFENTMKDQKAVDKLRGAADQALAMHKGEYEALLAHLVGGEGTTPPDSLQGKLSAAQKACDAACDKLRAALKTFEDAGLKVFNFDLKQIFNGLQSMAFVGDSPPAMGVMAAITAYQTLSTGFDTIETTSGKQISKDVLKNVVSMAGQQLQDIANTAVNIASDSDRVKDTLLLTELKTIDEFVSEFTKALGSVAQNTLDAIKHYRELIDAKNSLRVQFSNVAALLVQEYDQMQQTKAKQAALSDQLQKETPNALETVSNLAHMYLIQLEKTADGIAWLRRKYAYLTFNDNLTNEYIGNATTFWSSDASSNVGGDNDDMKSDFATVGSYENQLVAYESGQASIENVSPDEKRQEQRSQFYVQLDASNPVLLAQLLDHQPIVLTPDLPDDVDLDQPLPPAFRNKLPLQNRGNAYNIRVTHVVPWIEGVETASKRVLFNIRRGNTAVIVDESNEATTYCHAFDIVTSFGHYTSAKVDDLDNTKGLGKFGVVSNGYIDTRGIYGPFTLQLPGGDDPTSDNYGLHPTELDPTMWIANVKLRVEFWVTYQTKLNPGVR